MKFPFNCCQCGMCCLSVQCPVSLMKYGEQKFCPALSFSFDTCIASCDHAGKEVPIGDGCCIKAKAYKNGVEYDFAALPEVIKHIAVADTLKQLGK